MQRISHLIKLLSDEAAATPEDVFSRSHAASELAAMGSDAHAALPALIRTLVVPVHVDCALVLRVAAAEAVWKVGRRSDLALPFLAWALKDEYWGVSLQAVEVLKEMGIEAHEVVPDLCHLAERRLTSGPFHFERIGGIADSSNQSTPPPLLASIAAALERCGRGNAYYQVAHAMLTTMADDSNNCVQVAAVRALHALGPPPGME